MKFTLNWLRDHLDTDAPLGRITDTLTMIGLELESVTDPGAALSAFVVAEVLDATQHPNADRLRVCQVDTGPSETGGGIVTIVCGAPNARAGMKAVFAPPGSTIPATGAILRLGDIRGIQSAGMLLSSREMALGDDHDGIVELPADAPVGTPYPTYAQLDDPVIEIAVTPNRGDALSIRGIARDLAAAGLGTLRPWSTPATPGQGPTPIVWHNDFPEACPWILGRSITGLANPPSPAWLADRLRAIGLRPISTLVDITNFFTYDLGRPLHVFDAARLTGNLTLRRGRGEPMRALNNQTYTLTEDDCVIADAAGAQSLAGIIGGAATGCDAATTDIFVECAVFDPIRVALSGRRHQLTTDARQRFERGIDPALLPDAMQAATALIQRLCGGTPAPIVSAGAEPPWRRTATLHWSRLDALAGTPIPPAEAAAALTALGFETAEQDAASITVQVPSWRNDIAARRTLHPAPDLEGSRLTQSIAGCAEIEPQADLIEEILRLRGLDTIPAISLPALAAIPRPTLTPRQTRTTLARRTLASRGLLECVTFSFTAAATAALFTPAPTQAATALTIANPIAADLDRLRPTPLATLAQAAARNAARGHPDTALFEIGPAFTAATQAGQHRIAAGLRTGHTPRHWQTRSRPADPYDAKADALAVLTALGIPPDSLTTTPDAPATYHPSRSGTLRQGPKLPLAHFGELHPTIAAALDLPTPAIAFEIHLDAIPDPKRRRRAPPDLPALQPLRRDFAFITPPDTSAETLLRAARTADRTLITAATLFDVYTMDDGRLSLAIEVTLQPRDHTLTDAEIETATAKIVAAVQKATAAQLR